MFETNVYGYKYVSATVTVHFPVDRNGRVDARCVLCPKYRYSSRRCGLNEAICEYPEKYVGSECPFLDRLLEDDDDG